MKRMIVMAVSILLALTLAAPMALGQVGQGAKASGTAGELAAAWWQWALSKPVEDNPLVGGDPNYSEEQCDGTPVSPTQGNKWFLAGTFGNAGAVERTCTVPAGTHLFFPIGNVVFIITEPGETEQIARDFVNDFMDSVLKASDFSMVVTVDGKEVQNQRIVRADSPLFTADIPEDNVFDCPQCVPPFDLPVGSYDGVADGIWATLPPLSEGEHTIHFEISAESVGFSQDITYHLTVE